MAERTVVQVIVSVSVGLLVLLLILVLSQLGGFLNRSRGGFIDFESTSYWGAHILSRLLFAVPTGIVVLLLGVHGRAGFVVTFLTWFSLYVGWGVYFNIGVDDTGNYKTRSGVFDWLLGRQEINWTLDQRFVREYSGMSLRGLVWTAPQGYVLQQLGFGWEYSLSGSLMALVYYIGKKTPESEHDKDINRLFGAGTAYAEWYWGVWIWFVLLVSCLSQVVYRVRVYLYNYNQYQVEIKPFSTWEVLKYSSLNRTVTLVAYETIMFLLNMVFCCSVMFYSLITQEDIRNKGQTFFGMFTAALFLTFAQGSVWGVLWSRWKQKKLQKAARRVSAREFSGNQWLDRQYIGTGNNHATGEAQPLLAPSWPYGNGDRASPRMGERLTLPEGSRPPSGPTHHSPPHLQMNVAPANNTTAFLIIWSSVEKWMYMDIFVWTRRLIGIVSLGSMLVTVVMTIMATVQGWDTPRFMNGTLETF